MSIDVEAVGWMQPMLPISESCTAKILRIIGRPDLSDKLVKVIAYDASSACWTVLVFESIEEVQCKTECLVAQMAVGCAVEVHDSRVDVNGKTGKVWSHDDVAGRWEVKVPGIDATIKCKMENLSLKSTLAVSAGCIAEIIGLKSRPDLNGKFAKVRSYEASAERWIVQLPDSEEQIRCKPECLVANFVKGMTVELAGLQSRADLNGKSAKLVSYDDTAQRWECELFAPSQEVIRLKPQCLKGPVQKAAEQRIAREDDITGLHARAERALEAEKRRAEQEEAIQFAAEIQAKKKKLAKEEAAAAAAAKKMTAREAAVEAKRQAAAERNESQAAAEAKAQADAERALEEENRRAATETAVQLEQAKRKRSSREAVAAEAAEKKKVAKEAASSARLQAAAERALEEERRRADQDEALQTEQAKRRRTAREAAAAEATEKKMAARQAAAEKREADAARRLAAREAAEIRRAGREAAPEDEGSEDQAPPREAEPEGCRRSSRQRIAAEAKEKAAAEADSLQKSFREVVEEATLKATVSPSLRPRNKPPDSPVLRAANKPVASQGKRAASKPPAGSPNGKKDNKNCPQQ